MEDDNAQSAFGVAAPSRRKRLKTAAIWLASSFAGLIGIVAITVAVLLNNGTIHRYLLRALEDKASQRLGTRVQVQNLALHLSRLSADLYGVRIDGSAPHPSPPLLLVQQIEIGIRVVSLIHREWYLDTLRIDRPVVNVLTYSAGASNLPALKTSGNSHTSIFDLGIRHAVLADGELFYQNRESPLEADLHDLQFRSSFASRSRTYSGNLSYQNGNLRTGSLGPFHHSLSARFEASPSLFRITDATLVSGESKLTVTAALENYAHPLLQADYLAVLNCVEIGSMLHHPDLPAGVLRLQGSFSYRESANQPLLNAIATQGTLKSRQLEMRQRGIAAQITDIGANFSLHNGDATVSAFHAGALGGELRGTASVDQIGPHSRATVSAFLQGISLGQIERLLSSPGLSPALSAAVAQRAVVTGRLNAQAEARWRENFSTLSASGGLTLNGAVRAATPAQTPSLPVSAALRASYSSQTNQLTVDRGFLRLPQTTLSMDGTISRTSALTVLFRSNDLAELETIAGTFQSAKSQTSTPSLGLAGSGSFSGTIRGTTQTPHLMGQLDLANLGINGTSWRRVRANVELSPSAAGLQNGILQPTSRGAIRFSARAGLTHWSFSKNNPISVDLNASRIQLADVRKMMDSRIPVSGDLSARINLHGTAFNPIGQGSVTLAKSEIYQEPVRSATLTFTGTGSQISGNLAASLPAGDLESTVTVQPLQKVFAVQFTAKDMDLAKIQALQGEDAQGKVSLVGSGQGAFSDPQLQLSVHAPEIELRKQTISTISLEAHVANHVVTGNVAAKAANSAIHAMAKVQLMGDYDIDAKLDTQAIPLGPILASYLPSSSNGTPEGVTEVHATISGPLKNKKLLQAQITVPQLKFSYGPKLQLAESSPIHAGYKAGILTIERGAIQGSGAELQFEGSIPVASSAPMSLVLDGFLNLQLLQMFDPGVRSSGEIRLNINSHGPLHGPLNGTGSGPGIAGQVQVVNASFFPPDSPIGLQNGNGTLLLSGARLTIAHLQADVGGGKLIAQGGIDYRPKLQFDLGLSATNVRMLYPQGLRESIDAQLRMTGTPASSLLGGTVNIIDLSFTPAFDLTNFISQLSGGVSVPPTPGFTQNLQLNLAVRSSNAVSLVSRTLSIDGAANLQVRGTAAEPVILGRVNLSGGDVIFNGNRFVLNGGSVEFINPSETEPVVNLALATTIQQYNITMRFNGPIDQLRTNYSSDPSLPGADIINLLAFGQTTEANNANPASPANTAAESLLASQVSSQLTGRISKIAGISQLSINPVLQSGTVEGPPGANITIQQRVTGNLFVTLSTNVATTQNQIIMGQYQLSPRVAVTATRDESGGFAMDTLFKKTW